MKKRLYALALCLLLLTAFPLTAFADGEGAQTAPKLTITTTRIGDTHVLVGVSIVNNPGIAGVDLALHFNSAALTPSAPEMATGWKHTVTNYEGSFSRDTLKVVGVREESFTGDGTLFTASFTVKDSGSYALSADGVACAAESEELIELLPAYVDDFGVKTAAWEGDRLTVTLVSCGGAFHGSGKAMLACYDGGKFVGCKVADFTVGENATVDVMFDVGALSGDLVKLMLTDAAFAPLCAAVEITPDEPVE